jgi:hypothetical protein
MRRRSAIVRIEKGPGVSNFLCGVQETSPCDARERAADTDSPNAEGRRLRHGDEWSVDQEIHGFRRYSSDKRANVVDGFNPRGIQTVSASVCVGLQPSNRFVDIGEPANKALGTSCEQDAGAALINGAACGLHSLDCKFKCVQRVRRITRGILDRQPGDAGACGKLDVFGDVVRLDREAALEVGIDRYVYSGRDQSKVLQRLVARSLVVRAADCPRETGARGRQRREAKLLQRTGTADIPRVRHHKTSGRVQAVKCFDAIR